MARGHELIFALNAGGVDKDALSRIDLEKMRLAGEHPVQNWFPQVLGPMGLRPGLAYCGRIAGDATTRLAPFTVNASTGYVLGFSNQALTIFQNGSPVQVVASATAIVNPTFIFGGGGWSNVSDTGDGTDGTITLASALVMVATRWRAAAAQQAVTVAGGDQTKPHTLAIDVQYGPVFFRVGTSSGAADVVAETRLLTGFHKITFTPGAGTIYIRFRAEDAAVSRIVSRCIFEHTVLGGGGSLVLTTPWLESDLPYLAWDQSADVLFVGDGRNQPRRIERRGDASWSVTLYQTRNGPLESPLTDKVTLTPNAYFSLGTLTSNIPYFLPSHVGALFELTHNEQHAIEEFSGPDQATEKITITGLFSSTVTFDDRNFGINIDMTTGSFVGTIVLERATDADALLWAQVAAYTTDQLFTYNDEQSNLVAYYRLRVKSYTSGYANVSLVQLAGSQTGLVRVTAYSSPTSVSYETITPLGGITATRAWRSSAWRDDLGWPRVPRLFDARLWWFRGDMGYGSVVDDFTNYDDSLEGDSAPVVRSIGAGAVEGAQWALDMQRLIVGTTGYEASIRSSSFDEPITPTKFTSRNASTLGCSRIPGAKVDRGLFFVQRSGRRLYEMLYSVETQDYTSQDATRINPSALAAVAKAMAVQRNPDTRVYVVLEDGSVAVLTWERDDKVYGFTTLTTGGTIEDVCVVPDSEQDAVYFVVLRGTRRHIEKLAGERAQRDKSTCALLDAHATLTGSVSAISGATHLANQTVQVWADGQRRADATLNGSGYALLGATYARVVYGLKYTAAFRSVKLAYAAQLGSALEQRKRIARAGVVLSNACLDGIRIGMDATNADPLPDIVAGAARTNNQFFAHYDHDLQPVPSQWDTDARIYVEVDSAEGPVTVQAIVFDVETREAVSPKRNQ